MKPTIAMMRAREDGERSAVALAARGFAAVLAPVLEFRATDAAPPEGAFDALVVTSAKALTSLSASARGRLAGYSIHAVGSRTAELARGLGFHLSGPAAKDIAALLTTLRSNLPAGSRVLYLAGRDRRPDMERDLASEGHRVEILEVYAAEAREGWRDHEAAAVAACSAFLHYSERSSALAVDFATRSGVEAAFRSKPHVTISRAAAAPLRDFAARHVYWPREPDEESMLDVLETALADIGPRTP